MQKFSRRNFLELSGGAATFAGIAGAKLAAQTTEDAAAALPPLRVHAQGHSLQTASGAPFFWLADTAWQLLHCLTWEECQYYMAARARQGFTVLQIVALCEFDGIHKPNALGQLPFLSLETLTPNEAYFDHLVRVVRLAARHSLYVALLPTWGDKVTQMWGDGPVLFPTSNLAPAHQYAGYLARRLRECDNVVWMLGGDRPARGDKPTENWLPVWDAFAEEIRKNSRHAPLILYHPSGGERSTSVLMRDVAWLSVNGMQSGHGAGHDVPVWEWIARDYALTPPKPTVDLEPNYEDHPVNPWPRWNPENGFFNAADVRRQTYRSVFAGGCGVTYGHHSVWQFADGGADVINHAIFDWRTAIHRPGASQLIYLRDLMLSRPYFSRIPAPEMLPAYETERSRHIVATRDAAGAYALLYIPQPGMNFRVNLASLHGASLRGWWYDTTSGMAKPFPVQRAQSAQEFTAPDNAADVVLVLDSEGTDFPPPGLQSADGRG